MKDHLITQPAALQGKRKNDFNPRVALLGACMGGAAMMGHAFAFKDDPEGGGEVAPEIKAISAKIETSIEGFKDLIQKQEAEIKANGETSTKTANAIAQAEKDLQEMGGELKTLQASFGELEKKMGRPGFGGFGGGAEEAKSPGQLFIESEAYKGWKESGTKNSLPVEFGSTFPEHAKAAVGGGEAKLLSSASGSAGVNVQPQRLGEIIAPPLRNPRLRDLLMVSPTSSNAVEYVEETELHQLFTTLAADVAASTTLNVVNTRGFYAGMGGVKLAGTAVTISAVDHDAGTITLSTAATASKGAELTASTFEATPEAKLIPNMDLKFALKTVNVRTLAHGMPMTRDILEDAPRLQSHINNRGMQGLKLVEEDHILYGDGSSTQLQGIMTHPDVLSYSWSAGTSGDKKYDAIRRAMTLARLAEFPVTGVVLHPDDVEDIETAKGSDGHYLNIVAIQSGQRVVWRVPYVETTAIKSGEALVGAFGMGAEIFDRLAAAIRIAEEHSDFFMKRMLQLLVEERIALAIYRPQAFVKVTFDNAPA